MAILAQPDRRVRCVDHGEVRRRHAPELLGAHGSALGRSGGIETVEDEVGHEERPEHRRHAARNEEERSEGVETGAYQDPGFEGVMNKAVGNAIAKYPP